LRSLGTPSDRGGDTESMNLALQMIRLPLSWEALRSSPTSPVVTGTSTSTP